MKKILVGLALLIALINTNNVNAQIPVTDGAHIGQRLAEWFAKDIPYGTFFTQAIVDEIAALREYAPAEYAQVMAFLEDAAAEEFEALIGQIDSSEIVYSYNEEMDMIYHNSLNEWIKTAVMAEKSYNSASASQNKYKNLATNFLSTLSAADRESAMINTTAESTQSLQQLIKILAQQSRAEATQQTQQHKEQEMQEKAKYDPESMSDFGCPAGTLEELSVCHGGKAQEALSVLDGQIGGSASYSSGSNEDVVNAVTSGAN